jgi:hypothetical protein
MPETTQLHSATQRQAPDTTETCKVPNELYVEGGCKRSTGTLQLPYKQGVSLCPVRAPTTTQALSEQPPQDMHTAGSSTRADKLAEYSTQTWSRCHSTQITTNRHTAKNNTALQNATTAHSSC